MPKTGRQRRLDAVAATNFEADAVATFIGGRIRQARLVNGLSKEALAAIAGRSLRAVEYWEAGETKPSYTSLVAIATATGCDVGWLLTGEGTAPLPPARFAYSLNRGGNQQ